MRTQDLSDKSLDGADFTGATLDHCTFDRASLKGAVFKDADVRYCSFHQADLAGADFRDAILSMFSTHGNMTRANFRGQNLESSSFQETSFTGADMRGTSGWKSMLWCDFHGADLRGANMVLWQPAGRNARALLGAVFDDTTRFPDGLDPESFGAKRG